MTESIVIDRLEADSCYLARKLYVPYFEARGKTAEEALRQLLKLIDLLALRRNLPENDPEHISANGVEEGNVSTIYSNRRCFDVTIKGLSFTIPSVYYYPCGLTRFDQLKLGARIRVHFTNGGLSAAFPDDTYQSLATY